MITDIDINKPTPIAVGEKLIPFKRGVEVGPTIEALKKGKPVLINEFYSDGISLLQDVHKHLKLKFPNKSFQEQHEYRSEYYKLSNLILLEKGNKLFVKANKTTEFLFIAGKPIGEPIARGGPFVMNTKAEILEAVQDYNNGTFAKY